MSTETMNTDVKFKSKFPKDVFNEIKWKNCDLDKCKAYYISRGSPGDIATFEGGSIIEIGQGFLTLKGVPYEKYIPYHRIIKVEYENQTIFIRPGHVP